MPVISIEPVVGSRYLAERHGGCLKLCCRTGRAGSRCRRPTAAWYCADPVNRFMTVDPRSARQIAAAAIGNALEWYDFAIYSYFAVTISKLFFPPKGGWGPLLATFGLFAVAYVVRPVAGVILGIYADRFGRKALLTFVMGLMAIGSAMIAVAPTYQTVGWAAPAIVLFARLLQGVSAGGEFSSATAFLVEHAPPRRRGFFGAWQFSGQGAAVLLSGVTGLLVTYYLSGAEVESWGWRLPFAFGSVVGPVGLYIRLALAETPEFLHEQATRGRGKMSMTDLFGVCRRSLLIGLGLVLGGTAAFYVLFIFLPTYAIKVLKLGLDASFAGPVVAGATVTICCPIMGYASDRIGRRRMMAAAVVAFLVVVYPAFTWLQAAPSVTTLALVELGFGLLFSAYAGSFSAAIVDLFPVGARATAMAAAYNVGVALFGGGAPFIVAWLIARTGDPIAPAYYVMAGLCLTLIAIAAMRPCVPGASLSSCITSDASLRSGRQD